MVILALTRHKCLSKAKVNKHEFKKASQLTIGSTVELQFLTPYDSDILTLDWETTISAGTLIMYQGDRGATTQTKARQDGIFAEYRAVMLRTVSLVV